MPLMYGESPSERWWIAAGATVTAAVTLMAFSQPRLMTLLVTAGLVVLVVLRGGGARGVTTAATLAISALLAIPINRIDGTERYLALAAAGVLAGLAILRSKAAVTPRFVIAAGALSVLALHTYARGIAGSWTNFTIMAVVVLVGIVCAESVSAVEARMFFVRGLLLIAAAESLYAVFEVLSGASPLWVGAKYLTGGGSAGLNNPLFANLARAQGTLGSPLVLGFVLLVALAAAPWSTDRRGTLYVLTHVVLIAGVAATGSRNAVLLVLLILLLRAGRTPVALKGFAVAVVAVAATIPFASEASDTITTFVDSGSYTHRIGVVQSVQHLIDDRPLDQVVFGNGYSSTALLYQQGLFPDDGLGAPDNQWVVLLSETGLVGIGAMIAVLVIAARRADRTGRIVLLLLVAQFFVFDVLSWPASAALFWLFLVVCLGVRTVGAPSGQAAVPSERIQQEATL